MKSLSSRWVLATAAALLIPACNRNDDDDPVPIAPALGTPPAAPAGVTATPGDTLIELAWPAVPEAVGYHIESSTDQGGPYGWVERDFAGTAFTDDTLQNGTTYYYRIYAANAAGDSPPSAEVSATPLAAPAPGAFNFSSGSYAAGEAAGSVLVTVTRSGGSDGAVSVSFATSDGTALAGVDYTATAVVLSWVAGDAADQHVSIPILNRPGAQGDRSFGVTLSAPTGGATLGPLSNAVVTISD